VAAAAAAAAAATMNRMRPPRAKPNDLKNEAFLFLYLPCKAACSCLPSLRDFYGVSGCFLFFEICVVYFQLSQLYAVYARAHKSKPKLKNSELQVEIH
jgi:hypothetical protein